MGKAKKDDEVKAAEQAPETAKETNPVAEATREIENKDPYAEGKHIANPEPNNGNGEKAADEEDANDGFEEQAEVVHDQTALENDATNK